MFLKIHFEEDDKEDEPYEKLRVKSAWKPDQPPFKICQHLGNFECAMQRQFVSKRGKSNLIKFQAGILEKIRNNKSVIIAMPTRTSVLLEWTPSNTSDGASKNIS